MAAAGGSSQADEVHGQGTQELFAVPETDDSEFYQQPFEPVPAMHLSLPFIIDGLNTETSSRQLSTAQNILKSVKQTPIPNRPWIFYWCINALAALGEDVGGYNDRTVASLKPLQHKDGGFGGGNGQMPHMASVYAVVLTLAITTYHASRDLSEAERFKVYAESFGWIDRKRLLQWIRKTKLPSGGFKVNEGGEEDVRAGYCALVTLALLDFDEDELKGDASLGESPLLDGVLDYFQSCQTWEGGIGAKPHAEAHGGYAFCVLGALCLLGEPGEVLNRHMDLGRFISWLSARQYAPEGGFSGRTNKLVDGCYSAWVGGCWAFVEAGANGAESARSSVKVNVGSMWSRKALVRYTLTCCQSPRGGLRDKPGIHPDYYHSNYVLLGLSAAQHYYYYDDRGGSALGDKSPFGHGFCWRASRNVPKPSSGDGDGGGWEEGLVQREEDRVGTQHPVFNIPLGAEAQLRAWWRLARQTAPDGEAASD
ncbi:hypothetical protein DRE_06015 [Drechslerella stenobrocha 248]|uniref:Prenyltransferase alpha-alpha toroid domain-containing protein n=1 Tax=Drechslerella stenobrocha 248 TaxID=1043628 RepID=W7HZA1_9PEZI|nr:hypothetical protein DRE_06015 [Drechslerella stenobrocha 248]